MNGTLYEYKSTDLDNLITVNIESGIKLASINVNKFLNYE